MTGATYGGDHGGLYGAAVYGNVTVSLSNAQDPVETLVLLLDDDSSDLDYANSGNKPTHIERTEATERRIKEERSDDAIYVHARLEADHNKIDPAGNEMDEVAVVTVECWTKTSAAEAENLMRDVLSIIAAKANDSNASTSWVDLWPDTSEDFRAQSQAARRADHYVETVTATLRDLRAV